MNKIILIILCFNNSYAQSVRPGVWQAHTAFEVNGIDLPDSKKEECVTPSDAKDVKKTIAGRLEEKGCKVKKWSLKGKNLSVSLGCKKSGLDASGDLSGTVTETSYTLAGDAKGTFHELPSQAKIALKGQWLRKCN